MMQTAIFRSERTINLMKVIGGAIAIAAASQISIPLKPVPITFQNIAIMIIGLTYSPKQAISTMTLYLTAAAAGISVLSNFNAGLPYMVGATGGYLAGFFVAPIVMAIFRYYYGNGSVSTIINCLLGSLIIYCLGIAWLTHFIGFEKAFYSGFVVFIPTGIAKIVALTGIMRFIRR